MSDIPFVQLLGDQLEDAARRHTAGAARLRPRRMPLLAAAAALAMAGTAAAAGLLSSDDQTLATMPVSCYTVAAANSEPVVYDASLPTSELGSPSVVALCRRALTRANAQPPAQMVACSVRTQLAVIPGRDAGDCRSAGFAPVPAGYARAQARTLALERGIVRLEASSDCLAPGVFAQRVQALLDRSGWTGWTVRTLQQGPCGSVSALDGGGRRTFGGAFDSQNNQVLVTTTGSRRLTTLMWGPGGFVRQLEDGTGARCYSAATLRDHVTRFLAAKGIAATLKFSAMPPGVDLMDARGARYAQGCAVVTSLEPGRDDHSVTVEAWVRP